MYSIFPTGCHAPLQGIPTQGSNPGLPHCRWILYCLSPREAPKVGSDQIPGNPCSFLKTIGIILPLISLEITQPTKTNHPIFQCLSPSEMAHALSVECVSPKAILTPHSVSGICISLNKSTSYISLCSH